MKTYIYGWLVLTPAVIWIDHWYASLGFGLLSCVAGILVLMTSAPRDYPKRKEYRLSGIMILVFGCLFSVIALFDRFVIGYISNLQPITTVIRIVCL